MASLILTVLNNLCKKYVNSALRSTCTYLFVLMRRKSTYKHTQTVGLVEDVRISQPGSLLSSLDQNSQNCISYGWLQFMNLLKNNKRIVICLYRLHYKCFCLNVVYS